MVALFQGIGGLTLIAWKSAEQPKDVLKEWKRRKKSPGVWPMPWGFTKGTAVLAEAASCPQHPGMQPWREQPVPACSPAAAPACHHSPCDGLFAGALGLKQSSCPFEGIIIASLSAQVPRAADSHCIDKLQDEGRIKRNFFTFLKKNAQGEKGVM